MRERETERETDRERERQTERQRETERERQTETESIVLRFVIFAFSNIIFSCILKNFIYLSEEPFCIFTDIKINFEVFVHMF